MQNQIKTVAFLVLLSALFMLLGSILGGYRGLVVGLILATGLNFFSYWFSDRIILSLHRATEVHSGDSMGLYEMIERLSQRARIPVPRVYIIPDHSPNAFATGRNPENASLAVTQGLISLLNYQELEGVLAHEIAHIKSRDTLIGTIAAALATGIMFFANNLKWAALFGGSRKNENSHSPKSSTGALQLLLVSMVAPLAATLIRFSISRSREFVADASGARLCGNPEWLASALRKIYNMNVGFSVPTNHGNPALAHLYIVNPFSGSTILDLFSTHPPVEERISRLLGVYPNSRAKPVDQERFQ